MATAEATAINRGAIARMLIQLFDHWQLSTKERLDAFGLSMSNRSALSRYRKGGSIASTRDAMERADHLLRIHKNLRLLFPQNRDLAYAWMKTRNRAFHNKTPIEVIGEFGFGGVLMVAAYLNRAVA